MIYQQIRQLRIADVIAERLEAMILEDSLTPGHRLPPERALRRIRALPSYENFLE